MIGGMHMHGHDITLVAKNGHSVPPVRETTQNVGPGDFTMLEFRANNPGNWPFHCHFPHHTSNMRLSGYLGAPVGMTRVFHYAGVPEVPQEYFSDAHFPPEAWISPR
ncbi:cupredoxin domain-containing protein [Glycomyces tarimensis]